MKVKLQDLIETRAATVARMLTALDAGDGAAFDTANTELGNIDEQMKRAKQLRSAELAEPGKLIAGGGDRKLTDEIQKRYLVTRALAHACGIEGVDAGFEIEVAQEMRSASKQQFRGFPMPISALETRVTTTTSASDLVATDLRADLYQSALTAQTFLKRRGARTIPNLTANLELPFETGSPNVAWIAENSALTASDATFDSFTMSPHTVGALSEISRLALIQSNPAVDALVKGMMQRDIAREIDRVAINGIGGTQPTGILNNSNITHITSPDSIFDAVIDMKAALDTNNVDPAALTVITTPTLEASSAKARDDENRPYGVPTIFSGYSTEFTNIAPINLGASSPGVNHALLMADLSKLLIGIWGPALDILPNPFASGSYEKGNILIRALASIDIGLLRPQAFVAVTNGVASNIAAMPASA